MKDVHIVIIFIIALIVGYIAMNKIYIPYKTAELSEYNAFCENNEIKLKYDMMGIGQMTFNMEASIRCVEYKTSRCIPICENGKPVCRCEASIFNQLFSNQFEWLAGPLS